MLKILSKELATIKNLDIFLAKEFQAYNQTNKVEAVVLWEHDIPQEQGFDFTQIPTLYISEGFFSSFDPHDRYSANISLCVNPYNCFNFNEDFDLIEHLLKNKTQWFNDQIKNKAKALIEQITSLDIAKYNNFVPSNEIELDIQDSKLQNNKKVLIINQVNSKFAPANVEELMIKELTEKHKSSSIYLLQEKNLSFKTNTSYLLSLDKLKANDLNIKVIEQSFNSIALLKQFDEIFTIDSHMGFEALLLNKKVYCFGNPFYSGYGLTEDYIQSSIHQKRRSLGKISLEELFYVSYCKLCRYINPITQQLTSIEDIISLIAQQKQIFFQTYTNFVVLGASYWKKDIFRKFLSGARKIYFTKDPKKAIQLCIKHHATLALWSSKRTDTLTKQAKDQKIPLIFVEDGFIRSIGLGSNHQRPFSLVFDHSGIYYDPNSSSELENILNNIQNSKNIEIIRQKGKELKEFIVANQLTKYNVGYKDLVKIDELKSKLPKNKQIILVPGQVESDASVKYAGGEIKTNADLLKLVRKNNPDSFIIYKPHPDVLATNREEDSQPISQDLFDIEVRDISISSLYDIVDSIHTLCSQSGFEALLRNKNVYAYGAPFYAGWGLTNDYISLPHRKAKLNIDELCAGVLMLYPWYFDWCTDLICRAEDISYRFMHPQKMPRERLSVLILRFIFAIKRKIEKY